MVTRGWAPFRRSSQPWDIETNMGFDAWFTLAVVGLVIGTLASGRVGADMVLVGGVTLLIAGGVISEEDALRGLGEKSLVTIGALFIVAAGLQETGAMTALSQYVLGQPTTERRTQARIMLPVAVMSAFLNNTPVVAVMMPVIGEWAKKFGLSVSRLLLPLSYAAILGGTCTLIGTSTNMVINDLLIQVPGESGLSMFEIAWLGVPISAIGITFVLMFSGWLLPDRMSAVRYGDDVREYTIELLVEPASPLVGKTIEEAGLRHLQGVYLVEIDRGGHVLPAVSPQERLQANDQLIFVGVIDSVIDLQKIRGLQPATDQVFHLKAPRSERRLIEAVVSTTCPLVGKTIREGRFRTVYNAAVIAVARNGQRLDKKIGDISLWPGDTLLLEAHPSFLERQKNSRDFFLVSMINDSAPPRHERAWIAIGILAAMVALVSLGFLTMPLAPMLAAGLMLITRCLGGSEARRAVDWQVLIVIAAGFALSKAMQDSGAAAGISHGIISAVGDHPYLALASIYFLAMLFTNVITNVAAAYVIVPIAIETASEMGVSHRPFVMAVMIAASVALATPISYQTNLMVAGPGGYRFTDYVRIGLPLSIVIWIVTVVLAPLYWPF